MSWLYSQALVEAFSGVISSDGAPYAPLNGTDTPQAYLSPDKMTEFSRLSRFGMTYKPLTDTLGVDVLTWFLVGFPAKTSAPQVAQEKASQASEAGCGSIWPASLGRYDLAMHSLKTHQPYVQKGSMSSYVTLPRWGMMQNGELFQRKAWEPTTSANVCGSLLPTPTCHNAIEGAYPAEYTRKTPTLATHIGGKIHPEFTEWMMGWPLGWTDLKPLEMDRFREWQQQHSMY